MALIEKAIKETKASKYYSLNGSYYEIDIYAFPKDEAIMIINYLRTNFYPVSGLTLYTFDGKNINIGYAWWSCEKETNENPYTYLNRSCDMAIKYIEEVSEMNTDIVQSLIWEIDFSRMEC